MRLFCGGGTPNRNVQLILLFTLVNSVSYGIWGYTVLSGFLQGMPGGSNSKVGFAEGIQGTVQAIAAVPAGFMADKMGREIVLKGSAALGMVSILALVLALTLGKDSTFQFAFVSFGLALFGAFQGASAAPLEALFHDSIESSARARVATTKYIISIACNGAGPLFSLTLFLLFGDHWGISSLTMVMIVGVLTTVVPATILYFPRDADSLGEESEPVIAESPRLDARMDARTTARDIEEYYLQQAAIQNANQPLDEEEGSENLSIMDQNRQQASEIDRINSTVPVLPMTSMATMTEPLLENSAKKREFEKWQLWWVPRIIITTDMISGLASGMTIRFFPLFFKDETGLSPSAVNLVYVISPMIMVILAQVSYKLSQTYGRVKVPLVTNTLGILLLFTMYFMGEYHDHAYWKDWRVIVPIYLLRTALMNCTRPLRKALLMDFVAKDNRGFVNSLESISAFGWSGSAVVGGLITTHYGYGASFVVTAAVQALAYAVYALLLLFDVK